MNRHSRILLAAAALALASAGCGKKGPPLAPIVHIPGGVEQVTARRIGNDVYLSITIPTQNIDRSSPADIDHIDVYAVTTTTAVARARVFEAATKIGTIKVAAEPHAGTNELPPPPAIPPLPKQGSIVVLRDALTPAVLAPQTLDPPRASRLPPVAAVTTPVVATYLRRTYVAVAVSDRGRQGPPGASLEVPLTPLPDPPPAAPQITNPTPDAVVVTWEPSGGALGFVLERPAPAESLPLDQPIAEDPAVAAARAASILPPGPTLYNVYRDPVPGETPPGSSATVTSAPPAGVTVPTPINPAPIAELSLTDTQAIELGRTRCYNVRAVRGSGPMAVVGEASPTNCQVIEDHFAPAPPTGLSAAVDADGHIALIWEPNGEADLGGYLVLRGRAGDDTLQLLTPEPIVETTYTDRDVMPGVRYVYVVRAVDKHQPMPNASDDSNRVEETAR